MMDNIHKNSSPSSLVKFTDLPNEILTHILEYSSTKVQSLCSLQLVNYKLSERLLEYSNEIFWNLFELETNIKNNFKSSNSDIETYFDKYLKIKQELDCKLVKRKVLLTLYYIKKNRNVLLKEKQSKYEQDRVILLAPVGSGKSAITVKFVQNIFVDRYDPTIYDSYLKRIEYKGKQHFFEVVDTVEGFDQQMFTYLKTSDVIVFIMSIDKQVEDNSRYYGVYLEQIKKEELFKTPIIFCLHKMDLMDESKIDNVKEWKSFISKVIEEYNIVNTTIMETSAKTGSNINELFYECIDLKFKSKVDYLEILQKVIIHDLKIFKSSNKCLIC